MELTINKSTRLLLVVAGLIALTGCPGQGDRLKADETTTVLKEGDNVCFVVPNARDFQPSYIVINPRETPVQERKYTFLPQLKVRDEKLCIPPSFYSFSMNGQFVVNYILKSRTQDDSPRSVVVGVEFKQGRVENFPLANNEIAH